MSAIESESCPFNIALIYFKSTRMSSNYLISSESKSDWLKIYVSEGIVVKMW